MAWAARGVTGLLTHLPLGVGLWLGRWGGRLAGRLLGARRRLAERQLVEALAVSPGEAQQVARRMFAHLGMVAVEIAVLPRLSSRLERYVEFAETDVEVLRAALEGGQGALFVSAHLGNWELLAQRIVRAGLPAATVVRRPTNPRLERWLDARRGAEGLVTILRRGPGSARKLLRALKEGRLVGMLIDQDTRVDSIFVPFFGRLAATPSAPAQLAVSRGLPVVFGTIERRPGGGHRIRLEAVDVPLARAGEPASSRVKALTADLSGRIEKAVRRRPHEWVWIHERWRTPAP